MTRTMRIVSTAALATAVGVGLAATPAEAHGRGRGHGGGRIYVGGYYGYNPYFGFGYGPYFGPYAYNAFGYGPYAGNSFGPGGGGDMNAAMIAGQGALEMDVKPGQAEVWVDGEYVADAKDLDGYPSYLWLKQGTHHVALKRGGYAGFEQEVQIRRGKIMTMKVRLQKGDTGAPKAGSDEVRDDTKGQTTGTSRHKTDD